MIIRLFCPECAFKSAKEKREKGSSRITIDVPMPVSHLADDGRYEVRCAAGHVSTVFVDNLKFELLFEMGLNALIDGYPRDAVSSFASSLERFYEFYWHVATVFQSVPFSEATTAWKVAAKQSERQLGMFVTASLVLRKQCPALLNPNKEVKFRNDVIHGGYVPTAKEATAFGDAVMKLINNDLASLRTLAPKALIATYELLSPAPKDDIKKSEESWNEDEDHQGVVNIVTAVDVRYPVTAENDSRRGGVEEQFKRILHDRGPHRLTLFDEAERNALVAGKSEQGDME
jgi:hypothetical protein